MFRNIRFFSLDGVWPDSEESLSRSLETAAFRPCGPLTERSSGWIPIDPDSSELLARRVSGCDLLRLRSQSRVLPPAAVNEELENRVEDYRQRMQERPSAREKRRLKAEARDELLPKSLLKSDRIWGYVDASKNILCVDAGQEAASDRFIRRLHASIDGLDATPLRFAQPVDELLTRIFFDDAPASFSLGRECRMKDPGDTKSVVRWADFDLSDPTIRNHVANGMQLTHLAIVYDNVANFVLDENGMVTKLRFLGIDDDDIDHKDPLSRLDAEFVLLTGTLRRLLDDLGKALGGFASK